MKGHMESFITQEIGSLQRPIWRQKLGAESNNEWNKEALQWGERLGVEESEELINNAGTGLLQKDGKNRTAEERERIIQIASIYAIRMFETAGLDRVYNGEQPRTEMYDFLAKQTEGISTAGVLNSFDANYFRKGIVEGEISIRDSGVEFFQKEYEFVKANSKKVAKPCFTGPYTMGDWSYVEFYRHKYEGRGERPLESLKKGRRDAILDFSTKVLNPIVKKLVNEGAEVIQIDEPAAATNENDADVFTDSVNAAFEGVPANIEKAVHLCFSNYPALFPALAECKANSYLVEFTNHASPTNFKPDHVSRETFKIIELFKEYGMDVNVGIGVIDIHSDLIETPEVVRDRLLYAEKLLGDATKIQVNPDCGLRTRRWAIAYEKLQNMVKGRDLARKEVGD